MSLATCGHLGDMGHHMCSHTPLECPLGIPMGTSIDIHHEMDHLEGLQIGLRYLQNPEFGLFWTYPWNPRYHGNRPIWPFWTSEIPPVSSYSRLHIHIWPYSGHPLRGSLATCVCLGDTGHHMCSRTPLECPLGISIYISIDIYTQ